MFYFSVYLDNTVKLVGLQKHFKTQHVFVFPWASTTFAFKFNFIFFMNRKMLFEGMQSYVEERHFLADL